MRGLRLWMQSALVVAAFPSLVGCHTTIILGAPKWPPCYADSEEREAEADRLERDLPATYDWVREMDALCVSWSEP